MLYLRSLAFLKLSAARIMSNLKFSQVVILCIIFGVVSTANIGVLTAETDYIYGSGVHAFFDQNYEESITILSRAEELKSEDPRAYYFLGLAHLRLKQTEQADQYFKKAAELEYGGRSLRDYAVSESLRRIQGDERRRLEKIRTTERIDAQKREKSLQEARYGAESVAGREALRQTLPQNQTEGIDPLSAMVHTLGDNAFGLRPIEPNNPNNSAGENVAPRRRIIAPVDETAIPEGGESSEPIVNEPEATHSTVPVIDISEDVLNAPRSDVPAVREPRSPSGGDSPLRGMARGLGRGLGTLFSKPADTE